MMTRDRARKNHARARRAATGEPYVVARRGGGPDSPLGEVMRLHPQLTTFGIGVFDGHRKSSAQRDVELQAGRAELSRRQTEVLEVASWLRANITPIKTPSVDSYGLKHLVERRLGRYVTNGEAIAGALLAGYSHAYSESTGPNVLFGMSKRDVDRLRA